MCKRKRPLKECTNSRNVCLFVSRMVKLYLLFKVNLLLLLLLNFIYFHNDLIMN